MPVCGPDKNQACLQILLQARLLHRSGVKRLSKKLTKPGYGFTREAIFRQQRSFAGSASKQFIAIHTGEQAL